MSVGWTAADGADRPCFKQRGGFKQWEPFIDKRQINLSVKSFSISVNVEDCAYVMK